MHRKHAYLLILPCYKDHQMCEVFVRAGETTDHKFAYLTIFYFISFEFNFTYVRLSGIRRDENDTRLKH